MLMLSNANATLGKENLWEQKELNGEKFWQEASEENSLLELPWPMADS